jgi:hypothetical protein
MHQPVDDRPAAPPPERRENGYKYKPQWGVVVLCDGEDDQRRTYEELRAAGRRCKVVTV